MVAHLFVTEHPRQVREQVPGHEMHMARGWGWCSNDWAWWWELAVSWVLGSRTF